MTDDPQMHRNDNGEFHREFGPAVVYENGRKAWYHNGRLHRNPKDGPALIHADGTKEYRESGHLVRGPEGSHVVYPDGTGKDFPSVYEKCLHRIERKK